MREGRIDQIHVGSTDHDDTPIAQSQRVGFEALMVPQAVYSSVGRGAAKGNHAFQLVRGERGLQRVNTTPNF